MSDCAEKGQSREGNNANNSIESRVRKRFSNKSFSCPYCHRRFQVGSHMIKHARHCAKKSCHFGQEKKSKPKSGILSEEKKKARGVAHLSIGCFSCEDRFRTQADLEKHVNIAHAFRRSWECLDCGDTFQHEAVLKQHCQILNHRPRGPETVIDSNSKAASSTTSPTRGFPSSFDHARCSVVGKSTGHDNNINNTPETDFVALCGEEDDFKISLATIRFPSLDDNYDPRSGITISESGGKTTVRFKTGFKETPKADLSTVPRQEQTEAHKANQSDSFSATPTRETAELTKRDTNNDDTISIPSEGAKECQDTTTKAAPNALPKNEIIQSEEITRNVYQKSNPSPAPAESCPLKVEIDNENLEAPPWTFSSDGDNRMESAPSPRSSYDDYDEGSLPRKIESCEDSLSFKEETSALSKHATTEDSESQPISYLRCEQCILKFTSSHMLNVHQAAVHDQGLELWFCHLCDYSTESIKRLTRHLRMLHIPKAKQLVCLICGEDFPSLRERQVHRSEKHDGNSVACAECGEEFPEEAQLLKHHEIHETNGKKGVYKCSYCRNRFANAKSFRVHLNRNHGVSSIRHKCKCNKVCKTVKELRMHDCELESFLSQAIDNNLESPRNPSADRDVSWRPYLRR